MFLSVYNPDNNILNYLINNKVYVDARDNDENTALIYALKKERVTDFNKTLFVNTKDDVECVLKRVDNRTKCIKVNVKTKKSLLLITALRYKANLETIKQFVKNGASINFYDAYGLQPIIYATKLSSEPEIIEYLIDAGADLNTYNSYDGMNPLTYLIKNNFSISLIKKMLNSPKFNINYYNCSNKEKRKERCANSPLIYVIKNDADVEIADLLIQKGIDVKYTYYDKELKKLVDAKELNKEKSVDYLRKAK
ncbi:MAG: hypothetical protein Ta2D_11730 [Rickettsiales bacterium]|nr:MAG: hypothetical protein Ta2D_11730 [Rickettsiales bacterium]